MWSYHARMWKVSYAHVKLSCVHVRIFLYFFSPRPFSVGLYPHCFWKVSYFVVFRWPCFKLLLSVYPLSKSKWNKKIYTILPKSFKATKFTSFKQYKNCTQTVGLHKQYINSTQTVQKLYTNTTQTLQKLYTNSTQTLQTMYTNSTQTLQTMYTNSTQTLQKLYINSTQTLTCTQTVHKHYKNLHKQYTDTTKTVHKQYTDTKHCTQKCTQTVHKHYKNCT